MRLLEHMSSTMKLPPQYILGWGRKASHAYATYEIPKRRGGTRTIHHPAKELKSLQRWLQAHVISHWPVHAAAAAYRPGRSIRHNAVAHAKSRFLLKLDLLDYFPSISAHDIHNFLDGAPKGTEGWESSDRNLFSSLVCKDDRLTIGAPSSPGLSNALCYDLDIRLQSIAEQHQLTYTRYADDLFFSSTMPNILKDIPGAVADVLGTLPLPAELSLNRAKTRHLSKRHRRLLTGLVLGSAGEVSVGRARKRFIRRQIYRLDVLTPGERSELRGLLAFVRSVEPSLINALVLKYGPDRVRRAESPT